MELIDDRSAGRKRISRRGLVLSGGAAVAAVGAAALLPARSEGKFYPGVNIAGIEVGGLSQVDALAALNQRVAAFNTTAVTYVYQNQTWEFSAEQLGIMVDVDSAIAEAWTHGRGDGITGRYQALLAQSDVSVPLTARVNSATMDTALQTMATALNTSPTDATFGMDGTEISITPEVTGRTLNIDGARTDTLNTIGTLQPSTVMLRVNVEPAKVTASSLEPSRAEAALLVSHKVTVRHDDTRWTIDRDALARAIVVPTDTVSTRPYLDHGTIVLIVQHIADELNTNAVNAVIGWNDGVYAISDSQSGLAVDVDTLAQAVIDGAAKATDRNVAVPVSEVVPDIDSKNLDKLGITTLMGEGASSFEGSSDARATNVEVSAQKVTQAVIAPGGTLSFLDAVGQITVDAGFVEGKIISGGWYATDIGGGVCQVSTTVYRAALLAGLQFAEWHPHSVRVSFYELDGWPVGMDATVFQPETPDAGITLDLIIRNPTDSWILLQVTTDGDQLHADLYGADTGYTVQISDPVISDETTPGPALEKDDPDLPKGERQQSQTAQDGFTTTLTRTVTRDGEVVLDESFISVYNPVSDAFLVGTG
ncbi:VanW family protein [soil metagenome]